MRKGVRIYKMKCSLCQIREVLKGTICGECGRPGDYVYSSTYKEW